MRVGRDGWPRTGRPELGCARLAEPAALACRLIRRGSDGVASHASFSASKHLLQQVGRAGCRILPDSLLFRGQDSEQTCKGLVSNVFVQVHQALAQGGQGGVAVANIGRRALGVEERPPERDEQPSGRSQALVDIGAAAGCNAGALLAPYLASAQRLGVATEELRSALEISEVVKEHAAKFLRHDADKALQDVTATPPKADVPAWDCCAAATSDEASCG